MTWWLHRVPKTWFAYFLFCTLLHFSQSWCPALPAHLKFLLSPDVIGKDDCLNTCWPKWTSATPQFQLHHMMRQDEAQRWHYRSHRRKTNFFPTPDAIWWGEDVSRWVDESYLPLSKIPLFWNLLSWQLFLSVISVSLLPTPHLLFF